MQWLRRRQRQVDPAVEYPVGVPVTLTTTRARTLRMLIGSIVLVIGGLYYYASKDRLVGALITAFFVLGIIVAIYHLLVEGSSSLTLDQDGFVVQSVAKRPHRVPWADVSDFYRREVHNAPFVSYHIREDSPYEEEYFGGWKRPLRNAPMSLPSRYAGISVDQLIDYLERWRVACTEHTSPSD